MRQRINNVNAVSHNLFGQNLSVWAPTPAKEKKMRVAALAIVTSLAGCATATYQPVAQCALHSGPIRILSEMPPAGTYKLCGSLSTMSSGIAEASHSITAAQDEVRRFGGNAIVITRAPIAEATWEGYIRKGGAVVIELKE